MTKSNLNREIKQKNIIIDSLIAENTMLKENLYTLQEQYNNTTTNILLLIFKKIKSLGGRILRKLGVRR